MSPLFLLSAVLGAGAPATPTGSATLPLSDVVQLYTGAKDEAPSPPPPVSAVVTRSSLEGRLGEDGLVVDATFQVEVLADGAWTRVDLLALDGGAWVETLPALDGATVAAVDGRLSLFTKTAGRYPFAVRLVVPAKKAKDARTARLRALRDLPPTPMHLAVDGAVFEVKGHPAGREGVRVPQVDGGWSVAWTSTAPRALHKAVVRPPLEPRIPTAFARWVSTLEGKATLRVRYGLQVDRPSPFHFTLPVGHALKRVELNGAPVEVEQEGDQVSLEVRPARLGERTATLEVVLAHELGVFHLSGVLNLALPGVSWPIDELRARAHFPAVFDYRRLGGSMERLEGEAAQAGVPPGAAQSVLPGTALDFRQFLVGEAPPTVELGYSVNIQDSYFR